MVHRGKKGKKKKRSASDAALDGGEVVNIDTSLENSDFPKKKKKNKHIPTDDINDVPKKKPKNKHHTSEEATEESSDAPKKMKRNKNLPVESEQHGEKKMSKRQMKREKHAERMAESQEVSHKAVKLQALSYLSLWKHNKAEWKFNKVKQIYLYRHKFESEEIPDELWKDFVEYFASASGGIKKLMIEDSKKEIDKMEQWLEKNAEAENATGKPSDVAYKRARDLIQNIQE